MSAHQIIQLPDYWINENTELLFNRLGFDGWELLHIYNQYAYFMQHVTVPLRYKFIKNDDYMSSLETSLNTVGLDDWIFVLTANGYSVLKQIAIQ